MATNAYPQKFIDLNSLQTKNLNIVVKIEGTDTLFSLVQSYKKIRYGQDNIKYGDPGLVYGGLIPLENNLAILSVESQLTLTQKVEPEQGRASAATFSLSFVDVNGFMSNFVSPGQTLDELLGGKNVTLYLGYQNSSFKEDYYAFFRGYVTSVSVTPTRVNLQLTDSSFKTKQQIFFTGKTKLTSDITDVQTSITVNSNESFVKPVLGPNGLYDSSLRTYLKIDNEYMSYDATSFVGTTGFNVVRGAKSTLPAAHDMNAEVANILELEGNAIDLALKILLSGWGEPWKKDIPILSFNDTKSTLGNIANCIVLPAGIDAIDDYGLAPGDYIYVTGDSLNNGTYTIRSFIDLNNYPNNGIIVDQTTQLVSTTSAVMAIRSQYDTLPESCGSKLRTVDVDVNRFQLIRGYFYAQLDNRLRLTITEPESGKSYLESEIYLPIGAYAVTRFGRLSITATKPPIADDRTTVLDNTNIVEPQSSSVDRSLTNRRFFNEIQFYYDYDDSDQYQSISVVLDTNSLNKFTVSSVLPIQARGLRSDLGAQSLISRRGKYFINRFKDAAYELTLKANFQASSLIEVADIIAVYDNNTLKITNFETGQRDLGAQLYEVIEKKLDLKTGVSTMKLLSSLGYTINDRFAGISPSSKVDAGSSIDRIKIKDSYGAPYPGNEKKKWVDFAGEKILVRSYDWTYQEITTFVGIDPNDNYSMLIDPPLSAIPSVDMIVDIVDYPTSTDKNEDAKYKLFFAHISPSLTVVSGISDTQFTLSLPEAQRIVPGLNVIVRNADWTVVSDETVVDSVAGTTVTLKTSLGFTPSVGDRVELVGYKDGGGAYLIL